ncbi:TolC family protein [Aureibacillus halotolerans]|uniref:Outer membrane efflux protein n=1 Tax=Aureibacillus halotolerans TaxID=1508390 RepID=A0A4R6TSF7_9BACI|nr:TolC family protein [Aureibacillus halotolerans]TDQ36558.1 hypothetical protein EV213_11722 [Aureibacillus halotolerans]
MKHLKKIAGKCIVGVFALGTIAAPSAASAAPNTLDDLDKVNALTLDEAIDRALNQSFNRELLELQYKALTYKEEDLEESKDDLDDALDSQEDSSFTLPEAREDFFDPKYQIPPTVTPEQMVWMGPLIETNAVLNEVLNGIGDITDAMNDMLEQQRNELEIAIEQIETEQDKVSIHEEEAKTAAELMIKGSYIQVLSDQKQIELLEESLVHASRNVIALQTQANYGIVTQEDVRKTYQAKVDQEDQLKQLQLDYKQHLAQLSLQLGIEYNPDLLLSDIVFHPTPVKRKSGDQLLDDAYALQTMDEDIEQAEWEEGHTDTTSNAGEDYLEQQTEIAETTRTQKTFELVASIGQTYTDAEKAYAAYIAAREDILPVSHELRDAQARFANGVITRHQLDQLRMKLIQARAELELRKLSYYAADAQVEAMEEGLIQ